MNKPLNHLTCSVGVDFTRGWYLIDEERFYSQLTREATEQLKGMGLSVTPKPPGRIEGLGGGDSLAAIVQEILKFEPIVKLVVALVGLTAKIFSKRVQWRQAKTKQRISIVLELKHDKKVDSEVLSEIPRRAAVAFDAGMIVYRSMTEKYPLYDVELTVNIRLPKNGLEVSYEVQSASIITHWRFSRMIRVGKFKSGDNLRLRQTKLGLIEHVFYQATEIKDSPEGSDDWRYLYPAPSKYYTYVSNNIIGGYKRRVKSISWTAFLETR
jgi:hypothetical protein